MKYLLPCACGKSVPVETSQAGGTVRCSCGNALDVPPMRLLRQLAVADAAVATKVSRQRSWSIFQGLFFAIGLTFLVGGLLTAAYYQWGRMRLDVQERTWDDLTEDHATIDAWHIDEAWDVWRKMRNDSIGPYTPPFFVVNRLVSAYWYKYVVAGLIAAGGGMLFLLVAFVAGYAKKPRARRIPRKTAQKR
ncbi:MAG: hypothetical protein ACYC6N_13305 [Pirellulaceae bacterium]